MVQTRLRVLFGITGGIAAYKALAVVRGLVKAGHDVKVVLTENARQFVTPLSCEALSGNPVYGEQFASRDSFEHIALRDWADCLVVAPATANFLAKAANGLADDLLSTTALGFAKPRLAAPAMNVTMWRAAPTVRNVALLAADGWSFAGPAAGALACGDEGEGRMAEPEELLAAIATLAAGLGIPRLPGKVVVTAGATRAPIDAVRFVSNGSTGKMGVAVAEAAAARFAEVVLVHGDLAVSPPAGVRAVRAATPAAMLAAVRAELADARVLVMAAAVNDFVCAAPAAGKLKKEGRSALSIEMVPAPDILAETVEQRAGRVFTVGFAMETDDLENNARKKLAAKSLDAIVANPLDEPGSGFGTDTNRVLWLDAAGSREDWGTRPKREVAERILDRVLAALGEQAAGGGAR